MLLVAGEHSDLPIRVCWIDERSDNLLIDVERDMLIFGEDGQSSGPVGEYYNINARFNPSWWAAFPNTSSGSGAGFPGGGSPINVTNTTVTLANGNVIPLSLGPPTNWTPLSGIPWYPLSFVTVPQVKPLPKSCDPRRVQAYSGSGIQVLMMDGSTKLVSNSVSQTTWSYAVTPDDGQALGSDW